MTREQIITWATTYFIINGFIAVGFLWLARFIREKAPVTDGREEERIKKQFVAALWALGLCFLFGGKFLWAILSGQNLYSPRAHWEWVTKDIQPHKYWLSTVLDAGFVIICLAGFVCFLAIRSVDLNQSLDPIRKIELKLRWMFLLFWIFFLAIEIIIFLGYGVF